jgi:hypothetical protein
MRMAFWWVVVQLAGAAGGGFLATVRDPSNDVSVGIAGGLVASASLWYLELVVAGAQSVPEIVLLMSPLGIVAVTVGSVLGRGAGLRRERRKRGATRPPRSC